MKFDIRETVPEISVCLITYNHAPYIRECLDSMLAQETSVPYEICIGEDESCDGTREICVEYAEKHPEVIRLVLRDRSEEARNEYLSPGVYNYLETTKICRGRYIAHCDGDDVWLDPLKLQKQFDVMEADPSVSLVHSDCELWHELSGRRASSKRVHREYALRETDDAVKLRFDLVCMNYQIASSSTFMRLQDQLEIMQRNEDLFKQLPMGDTPTWCELLDYGRFHFINERLIARRCLPESDSSSRSALRKYRFVNRASNAGLMLGERYQLPMDMIRMVKVKNCNRYSLLSGRRDEIEQLYRDGQFRFPPLERAVYHMSCMPGLSPVMRCLFQFRYSFNNWRFRFH